MELIKKIIALAVIVLVTAACSREAQNGVDSPAEEDDPNGIGAAKDTDAKAEKNAQNDSVAGARDVNASSTQQGKSDVDFVLAAADGGLLEVRLGELAKQKGSSKDVKDFARSMTIDHGKANEELKSLAKKANISIPEGLSEKSQQKYNELAQKKGADFDAAYAKMMVADHQETIDKFRAEASNGQHQEIRDWAAAKIPTLEHHHEMAQKMDNGGVDTKGQ